MRINIENLQEDMRINKRTSMNVKIERFVTVAAIKGRGQEYHYILTLIINGEHVCVFPIEDMMVKMSHLMQEYEITDELSNKMEEEKISKAEFRFEESPIQFFNKSLNNKLNKLFDVKEKNNIITGQHYVNVNSKKILSQNFSGGPLFLQKVYERVINLEPKRKFKSVWIVYLIISCCIIMIGGGQLFFTRDLKNYVVFMGLYFLVFQEGLRYLYYQVEDLYFKYLFITKNTLFLLILILTLMLIFLSQCLFYSSGYFNSLGIILLVSQSISLISVLILVKKINYISETDNKKIIKKALRNLRFKRFIFIFPYLIMLIIFAFFLKFFMRI